MNNLFTRHCEEQSDEAIQTLSAISTGLLRIRHSKRFTGPFCLLRKALLTARNDDKTSNTN